MTTFQMKPMTGSLFLEEQKADPKHADFKGSLKIEADEYWLSGYHKPKEGKGTISLLLQKKGTKYDKNAPKTQNNTGAMSANERKTETKHPDKKGRVNVEGRDFWISGWEKKSAGGKTYYSLALTLMEAKPNQGQNQNDQAWAQPNHDVSNALDIGVPPDFLDS